MKVLPLSFAAIVLATAAFAQQGGFGTPVSDDERAAILAIGADERNAAAADFESRGQEALETAEKHEARIKEIAKEIARFEAAISDSRERLVTLARNEADASDDLHSRRRRHAATFTAIVALSKAQGPAIVAHDGDATVAARSATALEGLRLALAYEAKDTHRRTNEIHDLRERTEAARKDAQSAIASLRERERELWKLSGKRRDEGKDHLGRAEALRREAAQLESQAEALDVAVLRAPPPAPKPTRPTTIQPAKAVVVTPRQPTIAEALGNLATPVLGEIAARYDGGAGGNAARGLVFEAKPYSRVYAPWNGTISYAGPVKSFGLVTVIDIGEGHQIVLAGLASNERSKGEAVMRGEPIGHLGGPITDGEEFLVEQSALPADALTSLYFQMRRDGDPIDPAPWLE